MVKTHQTEKWECQQASGSKLSLDRSLSTFKLLSRTSSMPSMHPFPVGISIDKTEAVAYIDVEISIGSYRGRAGRKATFTWFAMRVMS